LHTLSRNNLSPPVVKSALRNGGSVVRRALNELEQTNKSAIVREPTHSVAP